MEGDIDPSSVAVVIKIVVLVIASGGLIGLGFIVYKVVKKYLL